MQYLNQKLALKPLLRRLVCILLMICMLPVIEIEAGAANDKVEIQYVWLISKPSIYYDYYYENGKAVFQCYAEPNENNKWPMYASGGKYVSQMKNNEALRVYTQFTDETTPTVSEWHGTKFEYTGRAATYAAAKKEASGKTTYHWAGNAKGGSQCTVDDDASGSAFTDNWPSSLSVAAPLLLAAAVLIIILFCKCAQKIDKAAREEHTLM